MCTPDRLHLVLRGVSVKGLDGDSAATAEREVRGQFELAVRYDITLRQSAEVTVQVTADVPAAVDRFNQEHGIPAPPYRQARHDGTAAGMILTVPGGASPHRHAIVMDAALWSEQSAWQVVSRAHGLAYFLGHLLNRYDRDRETPQAPAVAGEHAKGLWHTSLALVSAWDDCAIAADFCHACLRDGDGNRVLLPNHLWPASLQAVSELLDQLCVFAAFDVTMYRIFAIDLEDLYPTAMSLVCSLLRAVIGALSLFSADDQIDQAMSDLYGTNGFPECLEPVWEEVIEGCGSERHQERIQAFTDALTKLLHRLGLRIEDQEDGGLYVHVHEPVRCSWEERTQTPT